MASSSISNLLEIADIEKPYSKLSWSNNTSFQIESSDLLLLRRFKGTDEERDPLSWSYGISFPMSEAAQSKDFIIPIGVVA